MVSFGTISKKFLSHFLDALRINFHLTSLTFKGLELRNDLLYGLAPAMASNFVIQKLDLSDNCESLPEFCQSFATSNDTCVEVNLKNQTTVISEAFRQNRSLTNVQLDFQSDDGAQLLDHQKIIFGDLITNNRATLSS
jgi:hypothetical protein